MRGLLHSTFVAFAGLAGNMAGLRIFCVYTLLRQFPPDDEAERRTYNELLITLIFNQNKKTMKKKLLNSMRVLLVAAGLCVGANAWAVTETYSIQTQIVAGYNTGVTTAKQKINCYLNGSTEATELTLVKLNSLKNSSNEEYSLGDRVYLSGWSSNYWWIREQSYNVLYNNKTTQNQYFVIAGLSKGDEFSITGTNTLAFQTSNVYLSTDETKTNVTASETLSSCTKITSGATYVVSDDALGVDGSIAVAFKTTGSAVSITAISVTTSAAETMGAPSIRATSANGGTRTITITPGVGSGGSTATSTYYTLDNTDPSSSNGTLYEGTFEITETKTIKAVSYLGATVGEITTREIEAGTTLQLVAPSITRTAELGVSFDSNQSSLPGSPAVTYHYTLADGTTATGTSATDTKYGKVSVYASASGYGDSEAAEFTLAPTINGDATLSFVWVVPSAEKTITISTETTATYNDKTLGQLTYDEAEYAGLYLQSDGNWLARKGYAGLYNYTGNGNNAAYFGVSATEGQYIVIDMADGTLTANSNVEAVAGYAFNDKQSVFKCTTSGVAAFTVSKQAHIKSVYVYSPVTLSVANGYATYANHDYAVDLTNANDLIAYTATVSGDVVTFTRVNKIPAGTGVLLVGDTQNVPAITGANTVENNVLYAPETAVTGLNYDQGGYYNYILTQPTGKSVGFYRANNNNVAVGKAYLRVEKGSTARQFTFIGLDGESETTGISNMQVANNAADGIYNLSGQRVAQPAKGLYIVNGKKVIINK